MVHSSDVQSKQYFQDRIVQRTKEHIAATPEPGGGAGGPGVHVRTQLHLQYLEGRAGGPGVHVHTTITPAPGRRAGGPGVQSQL